MENIIYFLFIFFTNDALYHLRFDKRQIFSVFPESDLPAGVLRLVVQHESLAGVITFIRIAVLAMGLLQYCLNLSVMPPDCGTDCEKAKKAQSGNAPYGYRKWDCDVECSESGEKCQK